MKIEDGGCLQRVIISRVGNFFLKQGVLNIKMK